MSVIMSDMKTKPTKQAPKTADPQTPPDSTIRREFTVRDMNRQPQALLAAARKVGSVHVRSRTGERFLLKLDPITTPNQNADHRRLFRERIEALHEKMRQTGQGFTEKGWETVSKQIAGES
jgi:hypothetical protein